MKWLVLLFPTLALAATPLRIRNQCDTNLCWLHSGLQMIEQMAGEPLSLDALLIAEIKSRALARYLGHDTPWDGGAGPTRPFALALEHGLVPERVWNKDSVLVVHYHELYARIEELLTQGLSRQAFLKGVDGVITSYTDTLPPVNGREARAYARRVIGSGASIGYDFRNVQYDDTRYGRMGEVAWTTIASSRGGLVPIRQIIDKKVEHVTEDAAWAQVIRIFREGRPVAFTFIWFDHEGQRVLGVNERREYVAVQPATQGTYQSSHLVLVTGLLSEGDEVRAFEVYDPLVPLGRNPYRVVTREFFDTHGKTVHAIVRSCADSLGPSFTSSAQ